MIDAARDVGARIRLIGDGDVAGAVMAAAETQRASRC